MAAKLSLMNDEHSKIPVITIDGPSGTGKGTLCYQLAEKLQWHALDSGAIYRVLAYAVHAKNQAMEDIEGLVSLSLGLDLKFVCKEASSPQVLFEGKDISLAIRSELCAQAASKIAAIPEVRQALLARQRAFAMPPGLVTDGRDMGTVVFPNAILKIYLEASVEERSKRRYLELKEKAIGVSLAEVVEELKQRDARDFQRAMAPLKPAADAIHVDTTGLSIVQVLNYVLKLASEKGLL